MIVINIPAKRQKRIILFIVSSFPFIFFNFIISPC